MERKAAGMEEQEIRKGITTTGFAYEIEEERLDNWEIMEALSDMEENEARIAKLAKILLGKDQYATLKEHCKKKEKLGWRVSSKMMISEINEIFDNLKTLKN